MTNLKQLTGLANNLEHGGCFDAAICIREAIVEIDRLRSLIVNAPTREERDAIIERRFGVEQDVNK